MASQQRGNMIQNESQLTNSMVGTLLEAEPLVKNNDKKQRFLQ